MSRSTKLEGKESRRLAGPTEQIGAMRPLFAFFFILLLFAVLVYGIATMFDFTDSTVSTLLALLFFLPTIWAFIELPLRVGVQARRKNMIVAYFSSIIRSIFLGLFGAYFFLATLILIVLIQGSPVELGVKNVHDLKPFSAIALVAIIHSLFWTMLGWFDKAAASSIED